MPRPESERNERLRTFLAVELDGDARHAAAEVARAVRDSPGGDRVRWVRPENLHVTLRFLGEVESSRLPEVVARVGEEIRGLRPFELSLGALGWLSARVVFLEVEPAEPLAELAAAVERGVVGAGFEPERRPFRAHLTLGRLRRRPLPAVTSAVTAGGESFRVEEVVLFHSRLGRSGATYAALERIPLDG